MLGQWEQRQFLVRCPNNSALRFHIYLPVFKKNSRDWAQKVASFSFSVIPDKHERVRGCGPPPFQLHFLPPSCSLIAAKKTPKSRRVGRCDAGGILVVPAFCLDCGLCMGRVKVQQCWHAFHWERSFPSYPFFPPFTTTDRECWSLHWSFFFAFFPPQLLCVHAGRRCHTAITALNDHVGLDNDYPCQRASNTCGTPAFYRCGRMLWNIP